MTDADSTDSVNLADALRAMAAGLLHFGEQPRAAELRRLADTADQLAAVAHAAWHLMDDSGELDTADDNGRADFMHCGSDHDRLDLALDALEATGWDPHPEAVQ